MALEKTVQLRHEIEPNGTVFVVTKTNVTDDGAVVGSKKHRKGIEPGLDYSSESEQTRAICDLVQTDEVVEAYAAAQAANEPAAEEAPAE